MDLILYEDTFGGKKYLRFSLSLLYHEYIFSAKISHFPFFMFLTVETENFLQRNSLKDPNWEIFLPCTNVSSDTIYIFHGLDMLLSCATLIPTRNRKYYGNIQV